MSVLSPPLDRESASERAAGRALVLCGLGIWLCCLWFDRVSLPRGITPAWAEAAIRAIFQPLEAVLGSISEDQTGTGERVKILNLMRGWIPAVLLYMAACGLVMRRLPAGRGPTLRVVLGFAVMLRVTLVPFAPILETDFHRYMWDGAVAACGVNPYQYAPVEVSRLSRPDHRNLYGPAELRELELLDRVRRIGRLDEHFARINHPKAPTIYPPMAQALFSLAFRLAPGQPAMLKLLILLCDLAVMAMVVVVLGMLGRPREQVVVYAWCPLILKEYANTSHVDPLATLLVLVGVTLLVRERRGMGGLALGLATLAKVYPIAVAAVLLRRLGLRGVAVFLATVAAFHAPYLSIGTHVFDGLLMFAGDWEFNSGLFTVVMRTVQLAIPAKGSIELHRLLGSGWWPDELTIGPYQIAKLLCFIVGLLALIWLSRQNSDDPAAIFRKTFATVALLVLLSPVSNPWYYGWVMPFVALFPGPSWIYLSASMGLYYMYFWRWSYLPGMRLLEYVPFYALLLGELRSRPPLLPAGQPLSAKHVTERPRQD